MAAPRRRTPASGHGLDLAVSSIVVHGGINLSQFGWLFLLVDR